MKQWSSGYKNTFMCMTMWLFSGQLNLTQIVYISTRIVVY